MFYLGHRELQMSNRQLEEEMEENSNRQLAAVLGLSADELDQLEYEIHTNESNDGLIYEYVVHFHESSPQDILSKINGLSPGNYAYLQPYELETDPYDEELIWDIHSSKQFDNLISSMKSAQALLSSSQAVEEQFNLFVMLHAHVVASIEAFLSSTYIHVVTNSSALIRKVIETEPHFKDQQISFSEIYTRQENIKNIVGDYLKGIIFHKLKVAKRLYMSVLNIELGDIKWLTDAIEIRHHCTHRGGYDKKENKVCITKNSINELINNSLVFCERINSEVTIITKL